MEIATDITKGYVLANGKTIPALGFGTWQTPAGETAYRAVRWALAAGYRHIDTAAIYGNEESVGKAIRDSGIPRAELFVTTKLWNGQRGSYDSSLRALDDSLARLGLAYVDLYLIHWPEPAEFRPRWPQLNADSWRAMEQAYAQGKARAIGVSNFRPDHLDELLKTARIKPMVNQIFLNPVDQEREVVAYDEAHGIVTEAYSPLGTGELLANPVVAALAAAHQKTGAQILIRWGLEKGYVTLPKSVHREYIASNAAVFDFALTAEDMQKLDALDGQGEQHRDPHTNDFRKDLPFGVRG